MFIPSNNEQLYFNQFDIYIYIIAYVHIYGVLVGIGRSVSQIKLLQSFMGLKSRTYIFIHCTI